MLGTTVLEPTFQDVPQLVWNTSRLVRHENRQIATPTDKQKVRTFIAAALDR